MSEEQKKVEIGKRIFSTRQSERAKVHLNIVQLPDPILKEVCEEVTPEEISTNKLSTGQDFAGVAMDMMRILNITQGLGLSAPQVGIKKRFFIIRVREDKDQNAYALFINPPALSGGGIKMKADEGCLSMPDIFVPVSRSAEVKIPDAFMLYLEDTEITLFETDMLGNALYNLEARAYQHELDHLNGILITDRLSKADRAKLDQKK